MGKMGCKSTNPACPCARCTRGWYSRRHETRDARDDAQQAYSSRATRRPRQRWTTQGWEKVS